MKCASGSVRETLASFSFSHFLLAANSAASFSASCTRWAAWAGSFVAEDGKRYVFSTSVTTSIVDSESAAIKSGADNVVGLTRGDAMSGGITSVVADRYRRPFSSYDRGVFSFEALVAGRNTGAHEMGHFFGGRDLFAGNAIMN